jgi:hypothetical protein
MIVLTSRAICDLPCARSAAKSLSSKDDRLERRTTFDELVVRQSRDFIWEKLPCLFAHI